MKKLTGLLKRLSIRVSLKHHEMLEKESKKDGVSFSVIVDKALKYYWRKE
jgi:hypothetical protein